MMKSIIVEMITIAQLFHGFVMLNLLLSPLTVLSTFFIAGMGRGNPHNDGFLSVLATSVGFVYGAPLGLLIWLIIFAKFADLLLQIAPLTTPSVSWLGIFIAALLFVVAANIFIDNLYQFKQGNYRISVVALLATLVFVMIVFLCAKISIAWISI